MLARLQSLISTHRLATAFVVGAILSGTSVWTMFPRTITIVKEARHAAEWRPELCATGLSLDSPPVSIAICSDVFYPAYTFRGNDLPIGYLGLLRGCVIRSGIYDCKPATIDKL